MQATATTPPGKLDVIQSISTTAYDLKQVQTEGIWATTNGSVIIRVRKDMIDPKNGIEQHLSTAGIELLGQTLVLISEDPNAEIESFRATAQEFGIELGQNPGTIVENVKDLRTPAILEHRPSGMLFSMPAQVFHYGHPIVDASAKNGSFVIVSLDMRPETFEALKRQQRNYQGSRS